MTPATNFIPGSVGVIYVKTHRDSIDDEVRVHGELSKTLKEAKWFVASIDGDKWEDLSVCLNIGIQICLSQGAEYIHWCHGDFTYDDPDWFQVLTRNLKAYPRLLKICASNSRDSIGKFRIGQEQSWLMRSQDFAKYPWLRFDERFIRCGGCEDYAQHLNILMRGYLIAITPETTIHHKGAQTRSKYDTNIHQLHNQRVFGEISRFGQLVEVHQKEFFGMSLNNDQLKEIIDSLPHSLVSSINLEELTCDPKRMVLGSDTSKAYEESLFPVRKNAR